jgi:hypothetical protein
MLRNSFCKFILVMIVPVISQSQTLSVGLGPGFLSVQKSSFYTDPLGNPGIWPVNGVWSEFRGLGFGNEFQLAGVVQLRFAEFPATLTFSTCYAFLRGHGNTFVYSPSQAFTYPSESTTKMDLFSVCLGTDIYFLQGQMSPFLDISIQLNRFGESSSRFDYSGYWSENKNFPAYTRFGLGIGPGIDFNLGQGITTRLTSLYNIYSIAGRNSGEVEMRSITINALVLYDIPL